MVALCVLSNSVKQQVQAHSRIALQLKDIPAIQHCLRFSTNLKRISNLRWWIAGLLASATALAYVDRQTLPLVVGEIQKVFPISNQQYGNLQFTFILAYGIMYAGAGKVTDVVGSRWGFFAIIVWWSAANLFQADHFEHQAGWALDCFFSGLVRAECFPAGAKVISEWFPARDRSLAFGILNTGSGIGATIAPPLIAAIVLRLNWRWVFFLTGAAGFAWAVMWLVVYRPPSQHKFLSEHERNSLDEVLSSSGQDRQPIAWLGLFRYRQIWGLVFARFLGDSAWFFVIFWLPKYLLDNARPELIKIRRSAIMRGFRYGVLSSVPWQFGLVGGCQAI